MRIAIQKKGKIVSAWKLAEDSLKERELLEEGRIVLCPDGSYELFSQKARSGHGEKAQPGDWFIVDSSGFLYSNDADFFAQNHRHIEGDTYEQLPKPVSVWFYEDGMCEETRFLIEHRSLTFDENHPDAFFSAPLWGTVETAKRDAAVVFYSVTRDGDCITDVDFNFVERGEFERTYTLL